MKNSRIFSLIIVVNYYVPDFAVLFKKSYFCKIILVHLI